MTARSPDRTAAIEAFYREHHHRLERRIAARPAVLLNRWLGPRRLGRRLGVYAASGVDAASRARSSAR